MQHDTSDILFSLFMMTLNLKGSVGQEFSFIVQKKRKKVTNSNKIHIFGFSSITTLNKIKHDISDILFSAFNNTFVMKRFICFTDIFIYKQFSFHEFIKNLFL